MFLLNEIISAMFILVRPSKAKFNIKMFCQFRNFHDGDKTDDFV